MRFIDAHAHILNECFNEDVDLVVKRAEESGVEKIICAGYDLSSSKKAVELAHRFKNVYATVGLHPENVEGFDVKDFEQFLPLMKDKKCVAIGEIGLDYHFRDDNKELQKLVFSTQIKIANELDLPIVVHSRDAMGDTIDILQKVNVKKPSLMHCYSGSIESAKILMKLGFSFSFGGVVTFKNAKNVVEVVNLLPIENILLETDCPFMTPVPFRGERNEPKNVVYVADKISRIKDIPIESVADITTQNAKRIFNIWKNLFLRKNLDKILFLTKTC